MRSSRQRRRRLRLDRQGRGRRHQAVHHAAGPATGLVGVDAETGKFLWNYNKIANGTANIPTAIVKGDLVFASTGYGTGAALLKLVPDGNGGIKAEEEYFLKGNELQNHHGGMVMLGDYIYGGHGHNNGLAVLPGMEDRQVRLGAANAAPASGSAAVLYADGHLYFRYENGEMALVEATPEGVQPERPFRVRKSAATAGRTRSSTTAGFTCAATIRSFAMTSASNAACGFAFACRRRTRSRKRPPDRSLVR